MYRVAHLYRNCGHVWNWFGEVSTALRILERAEPCISGFSFEQAIAKRSMTLLTRTCWYIDPLQPVVYGRVPTVSTDEAFG